MISLAGLDQAIAESMKSRDQVKTDTLRGLKTRLQNEQKSQGGELAEEKMTAIIRSEIKRRNEAAESYHSGGRVELAEKERSEAVILQEFLPPQLGEQQLAGMVDQELSANNWTAKDFGVAMKTLKEKFGDQADGAALAKILKSKL